MSDLSDLNHAYDQQCHAVRSRIEQFARAYWENMPNYRDDAIDAMVEAIVPRVIAGQQTMARLTNAYLKACSARLGLDDPVGLPDTDMFEKGLRGVDPRVVYRRPATTVYTKLARGRDFDSAASAGQLRLLNLIGTDLQMARTHTAQRTMSQWGGGSGGQRYYRRTLTGRENCALCVVASTQHYKVSKVMPIHPGCDCGFEPLPPGVGKDWVIDPDTLEQAHQAVEALGVEADRNARNPDYRKIIIERRHGEVGPLIALDRSARISKSGVPMMPYPKWTNVMLKTPMSEAQLRTEVNRALKLIRKSGAFPNDLYQPEIRFMKSSDGRNDERFSRGKYSHNEKVLRIHPRLKNPTFTIIHEFCHVLDFQCGDGTLPASAIDGSDIDKVVDTLFDTESGRLLSEHDPYFGYPHEVFARAYAQYTVIRSGDEALINRVYQIADKGPAQWTREEFEHLLPMLDELAAKLRIWKSK